MGPPPPPIDEVIGSEYCVLNVVCSLVDGKSRDCIDPSDIRGRCLDVCRPYGIFEVVVVVHASKFVTCSSYENNSDWLEFVSIGDEPLTEDSKSEFEK